MTIDRNQEKDTTNINIINVDEIDPANHPNVYLSRDQEYTALLKEFYAEIINAEETRQDKAGYKLYIQEENDEIRIVETTKTLHAVATQIELALVKGLQSKETCGFAVHDILSVRLIPKLDPHKVDLIALERLLSTNQSDSQKEKNQMLYSKYRDRLIELNVKYDKFRIKALNLMLPMVRHAFHLDDGPLRWKEWGLTQVRKIGELSEEDKKNFYRLIHIRLELGHYWDDKASSNPNQRAEVKRSIDKILEQAFKGAIYLDQAIKQIQQVCTRAILSSDHNWQIIQLSKIGLDSAFYHAIIELTEDPQPVTRYEDSYYQDYLTKHKVLISDTKRKELKNEALESFPTIRIKVSAEAIEVVTKLATIITQWKDEPDERVCHYKPASYSAIIAISAFIKTLTFANCSSVMKAFTENFLSSDPTINPKFFGCPEIEVVFKEFSDVHNKIIQIKQLIDEAKIKFRGERDWFVKLFAPNTTSITLQAIETLISKYQSNPMYTSMEAIREIGQLVQVKQNEQTNQYAETYIAIAEICARDSLAEGLNLKFRH